jgi:putative hydrolase of the HAD superfamily
MREYDAWLVDLDGTLYAGLPVKIGMALELALGGWPGILTLRVFRREHERLRSAAGPAPSEDSPFALQIRRTAEARGLEPAVVEALAREWMIRRPLKWIARARKRELLAEIAEYRRLGGRTALVSDYPARDKLEALGALALFDVVVASGEPGGPSRLKPHPEGYLLAAAELGVAPERCLVVGDREDADGSAARAAGMAFRRVR